MPTAQSVKNDFGATKVNRNMIIQRRLGGIAAVSAALLMSTVAIGSAAAQTYTVLHNFTGTTDGFNPFAGLIRDSVGNLYGITTNGGPSGVGVVFFLDRFGRSYTVLHNFADGTIAHDGAFPVGGLTIDAAGNLYGTTARGGSSGNGTVFKLDTFGHNYTVLHNFSDGTVANDGAWPDASLTLDSSGHLYGTTLHGGAWVGGPGTVFKLETSGQNYMVLHDFSDGSVMNDGYWPSAALTLDSAGNLYGTTQHGGSGQAGIVFKLGTSGANFTVLHSFGTVLQDGQSPWAGLALDSANHLYGTTTQGGSSNDGTVFKLDTSGNNYTVLHNFGDGTVINDGAEPYAGLTLGPLGTLYGTTSFGGVASGAAEASCGGGCGTVFQLDTSGNNYTVLHNFGDGTVANDGINPYSGLVLDSLGSLFGTTVGGGSSWDGTAFGIITTPPAATQMMINQVNALYAEKVISSGQRNSLVNELQNAISLMKQGKTTSAIHSLQAFVSEVKGFEHTGVLTSSQVALFINEADVISEQLQLQ